MMMVCMNIQYYGDYCFKITVKPGGRATDDVVLWTDPPEKSVGLRLPQGQAHAVFFSHDGDIDISPTGFKGDYIRFRDPGEYAVQGINVIGIQSFRDDQNGALRGQNTIFVLHTEGFNICFLGALGHELTPQQIDKIALVDILFLPVGNRDTLNVKQLDDVIRKLEPSLVIPMHYAIDGMISDVDDIKVFCDEIGNCPSEKIQKLTVKKKDLEGKSMEIVLMEKV